MKYVCVFRWFSMVGINSDVCYIRVVGNVFRIVLKLERGVIYCGGVYFCCLFFSGYVIIFI